MHSNAGPGRDIEDAVCYAVCIAVGGGAMGCVGEWWAAAHKTPRRWLKPEDG